MEKLIREVVLKRTVEDTGIPEEIAEKVIAWSYRKANEATRTLKEIEISGLGTFKVSPSKAKKRIVTVSKIIEKLEKKIQEGRSTNVENDMVKLERSRETLTYCLSKLSDEDRAKQDIRGIVESSLSQKGT